jgi:hypothetical protein
MKIELEKFGTIGTFLMALTTALPCCLPLLATTGAALGLSFLHPYQEYLNYLLQGFVLLTLVGHFKAYSKHHNHGVLGLSLISAIGIFIGYNFVYSANIIYPSLLGLVIAAGWNYFVNRKSVSISMQNVILDSVITCPVCGTKKLETMPTDACMYFYECTGCKTLLKPKKGDCCVFCSFGSVKCPPIQTNSCSCH